MHFDSKINLNQFIVLYYLDRYFKFINHFIFKLFGLKNHFKILINYILYLSK